MRSNAFRTVIVCLSMAAWTAPAVSDEEKAAGKSGEEKTAKPGEDKTGRDKKAGLLEILKIKKDGAKASAEAPKEAEKKEAGEKGGEKPTEEPEATKEKPDAGPESKEEKKEGKKSGEKDDPGKKPADPKAGADDKKEGIIKIQKDGDPVDTGKQEGKVEKKDDGAVEVKLDDGPAPAALGTVKEKAEKAEKKEEKKPAAVARKKDPDPPMFRLRDGTRLAGTPEMKQIHLKTPYGKLVVPIAEVVRVRFAAAEDMQLAARVAENVKALASEEFDRREEAMAALREIGVPALEALKKAVESDDEEVKSRAEKLSSEIEETMEEAEGEDSSLGAIAGDEDEVVTLKFTARGLIEEDAFPLATRYGALRLSRNDIVSVLFQEAPTSKVTVQVPGATFAAANKWVDSKLAFLQGERLRITATGQISLENYGQTTGPEGTTNVTGNQLEGHATGALVGKIGEKGKPFFIGADHDETANASGNLLLGISLQNGNVSGQYQVEVEKESGS